MAIQSYRFFNSLRIGVMVSYSSFIVRSNINLINFTEEGSEFDREWKNKTQQFMPPNAHHSIQYHQHSQGERPQYLALPPVPRYGMALSM